MRLMRNASHQPHPFIPQSPRKIMNPMIPMISITASSANKMIPKIGIARPARTPRAPDASMIIAAISCRIAMIVTPKGRSANFFHHCIG